MPTIKIPREELIDILYDGDDVIEDEVTGNSRWSTFHYLIFKYNGKVYGTSYQKGSTEMQDEEPWEGENKVVCEEMHQVEKIVKIWEAV